MRAGTFDKLAGTAILLSIVHTVSAATSWEWFPTPGDWSDIAHIPKGMNNYLALLLPPSITLVYLVVRRRCFDGLE